MDHSIVPIEWKKFLSAVQTLFPDAVIAGGALRDLIVEKPIKDVDIFISDMDMQADIDEKLNTLAETLGIKVLTEEDKPDRDFIRIDNDFKQIKNDILDRNVAVAMSKKASEYLDSDDQRSVYESFINYIVTVKYNSVLYQLIFVEAPTRQYVYNDFDFGICKVFFDGNKLTVTEEFWYDLEHKQITFAGKFSTGQAIHTLFVHRENMVKKFPGWKVVIDDLKKRGPEDMPPSYRLMEERVAAAIAKKERDEALKVKITTKQVDEDGNGVYFDVDRGYYLDKNTGDVFVKDSNGKKLRIMDVVEKYESPSDSYTKNIWDQYATATASASPWIDTDYIYRREKDREYQEMMKQKVKLSSHDLSDYFSMVEKAKQLGIDEDDYFKMIESMYVASDIE